MPMALPTGTASSCAIQCSTSHIHLCMQDNAATFLENKPPAQQKAFPRHTYTFIKHAINSSGRLKTATNSKCLVLQILASSSQSVQLPAMDFATGKKSSLIQGIESNGKHNHLSSFQYCSTGFILTSNKKPTSTKA